MTHGAVRRSFADGGKRAARSRVNAAQRATGISENNHYLSIIYAI
jgi:hypothetical protein